MITSATGARVKMIDRETRVAELTPELRFTLRQGLRAPRAQVPLVVDDTTARRMGEPCPT
jgi:hypothetical protein